MEFGIQQFMSRKVIILNDQDTVEQAAKAMSEHHVGCILTNSKDGVSGIITDRDLACHAVGDGLPGETMLMDVHTQEDLNYVAEDSNLTVVIEQMKRHGIRRVPILKKVHHSKLICAGLVTLDELIVEGLISMADVQEIIKSQVPLFEKRPLGRLKKRKEARKEQSLNIFFKTMARQIDIDRSEAEILILFLLKILVSRVTHHQAMDLMSSLPMKIQDDLKEQKHGPDPSIDAQHILQQLQLNFGLTSAAAERRVKGFWLGLEMYLLNKECQHILNQLPSDLQILFTGEVYNQPLDQKQPHRSVSLSQ